MPLYYGLRAQSEQGERDDSPQGRTEGIQIDIELTAVYATMQPQPVLDCPSASMGVEWMGSDSSESDVLDVMVKRVANESIDTIVVCVDDSG